MKDYDIETLAQQPWEETLEVLTADMDPENIDIIVLTGRYKEYVDELQGKDLEVPAKAIRICSALLKMKTLAMYYEEEQEEQREEENPMDFEEEPIEEERGREPELDAPPELDVPVKAKPRRRVTLDELKDSLESALEVKERREERQQQREEIDEHFEVEEKDITEKINNLFSRIQNIVSRETQERIEFEKLIEENTNEEKIEKFKHILHLENDRKVNLIQEEFLGDLEVKPKDEEVAN
ncbi:MAG: segregation/condensation protein A [Candidatus Nanohaloarchaea archaeon]